MERFSLALLALCTTLVVVSAVYIDPFGERHHRTDDGQRRRTHGQLERTPDRGEGQHRRQHRHRWHRWLPEWFTRRSKGQSRAEPWTLDFDLDKIFNHDRHKPWWRGPNVCETTEAPKEEEVQRGHRPIAHHLVFRSTMCDDSGSAYRCTTTMIRNGRSVTTTSVRACCHGYMREKGKPGCVKEVELNSTMETARLLGAAEFVTAVTSVDLADTLDQGNYTLFVPVNQAFKAFKAPFDKEMSNRIEVTPKLLQVAMEMQDVISGHVVEGWAPTSTMSDGQLLQTTNVDSKIRINFYSSPRQLMTANCVRVRSPDNMATNGVLHLVDKVLVPAQHSLLALVSKDPELSMLKTVLAKSGISTLLKEDSSLTLFAPTNKAFEKMDPTIRVGLMSGKSCFTDILKSHILPNVVCSGVLAGKAWTNNLLNHQVSLHKNHDGKFFFNGAQMVKRDIMATNGVLHVVDSVNIPASALGVTDVLKKAGAKKFLELLEAAGLQQTLNEADNVTVFVPTDKAFDDLPEGALQKLRSSPATLRGLLRYHMAAGERRFAELEHNQELKTLAGGSPLVVRIGARMGFRLGHIKSVQCAQILTNDLKGCGGMAHFIDKVLIPPKGDLVSTLENNGQFSTFLDLLKKSGLHDQAKSNKYTVLAPTNEAFKAIDSKELDRLKKNKTSLQGFLHHYLMEGYGFCCASITKGLPHFVPTLSGQHAVITRQRSWLLNNIAAITRCDTMATNGIIQGINKVLPEAVRKYLPPPEKKPVFQDGLLLPGLDRNSQWIEQIHRALSNEDLSAFEWTEEFFPDGDFK